MPHEARSFAQLPDAKSAGQLLAEIATAPCPYTPVTIDRPLALYGAGNFGRLARDFLKTVGHDFAFAIDRNARAIAQEPGWAGARVVPIDGVPDAERSRVRLAISVVLSPYVPIERELATRGFTDIVPFFDVAESFRAVHPLSNGWFATPLSPDDQARTVDVLARWDDDASRAHHLKFLAWRRQREEWTFTGAPHPNEPRFFIPEVKAALREDEIYVDAGAYHGTVIGDFLIQTKGRFRQVIAIEPDTASRAILETTVPKDERIAIVGDVLADREGPVIFHDGLGYASQISPTGRTKMTARTIDTLGLTPSFMKLHLEGGELPTLKGAKETLLAHRPMLAITVYHNADGIWRTPLWLMETLPDYRFLFRTHAWCGNGAVIYAIPRER
ncbi:MAG: FkbM family methyltransferase [Pseudolabrys sp.]|nr:FkbM family methyltransferase [Pseudolabrys sp.]